MGVCVEVFLRLKDEAAKVTLKSHPGTGRGNGLPNFKLFITGLHLRINAPILSTSVTISHNI